MSRFGILDSIPAPVGGWNSRDSLADMDPRDAVILDNWFPMTTDVMLRKGRTDHVTGISGQVESLMAYAEADGSESLFAAAGTSFYDVTVAGAVGAAVQSGLTNARWQHVNFTDTSAATWLVAMNGTDKPRYWNGTAWTAVDSGTTPAIIGVTSTELDNPWLFQKRLWAVEKDSLRCWYLPSTLVGGTASAVDISSFCRKGGYLVAGGSWTLDAGTGVDDHMVLVTSEGEVIVYKGSDPSSSSTWSMVGRWELGQPIGKRCLCKYAGDLLLITVNGVVPLSKALISDRLDPRIAITDKIQNAMNDAAAQYKGNFGWQTIFYPAGPMVLLNVPVQEGSDQEQFVQNTLTGSWCRFTDWAANCFELFNGDLYFGGNGVVKKAWEDFDDDGTNIEGDAKQAFNYFKRRIAKQFTMARPIFESDGTPTILMAFNIDYDDNQPSGTLSFSPTTYGLWDSAVWDSGIWGGVSVLKNWQGVNGIGFCAAPRLKANCRNIELRWTATDVLYKPATGVVV